MYQSPRIRRLHNDLAALERLRSESSVFRFIAQGDPPQQYLISFKGKGLWRDRGKVRVLEDHHVEIKLGASYPRTMPEIRWMTPIYHPNISEIGMVCLGGYGTHWVPSVQLDELCVMLWDMARYHNYDIRSPYNRDAALWVANQTTFLFPTDSRPVRDLRAALGRVASTADDGRAGSAAQGGAKGIEQVLDRSPARSRLADSGCQGSPVHLALWPGFQQLPEPRNRNSPNRPAIRRDRSVNRTTNCTPRRRSLADSGQANRHDPNLDELVILEPVSRRFSRQSSCRDPARRRYCLHRVKVRVVPVAEVPA